MNKIVIQGAIAIILFFGTWFVLTQIDWIKVFEVQKATDTTEEKLGKLLLEVYKDSDREIKNKEVLNPLDSIVNHICKTNEIDKEKIKVHILNNEEINAFALPYGNLIIYSGLILNSDVQEELTGVICHEIAHIELNHVMKKLVKEIGLSVLISMTTGNSGGEVIKETAKMLSSSAFDRSLEKEADIKAVDYLINANVNPEPLANFLYKLSEKEHEALKYITWISSHPDSKERAEYIIEYSITKLSDFNPKPILTQNSWEKMKDVLRE